MKILIAGFGSIGRRHLRNLRALGEQDILLYRTGHSTLADDELAGLTVETSLEAALRHQPQAVIVANPTALHLDIAIPAAEAGCHLFLEKPISHSLEGVADLQQAVARSAVQVLVGFQFHFHPGLPPSAVDAGADRLGVATVAEAIEEYLSAQGPSLSPSTLKSILGTVPAEEQ